MVGMIPGKITRGNCSALWRGIAKIWALLKENLCWSIGTRDSVNCWEDPWVPKKGPLKTRVLSTEGLATESLVKDIVTVKGTWDINTFRNQLPEDIIQKILNIPPPHSQAGPNKIFWMHTSNGKFTIKSAYQMIKGNTWNEQESKWKKVWKFPRPQRVRFFLWLVYK
ncbi:hypothetical protein PVK06_004400 [Gossypium arboreum]|uniref:Reverse transcriptase zinc-binding domain-containing protein n=1 Tax=Gossypium arboreum TaxID=29729 RepID=A0ABR0QT64_GOSAR|nr:hypothetical protein PVK06_004400 [Gossypium arboreum]